MARSPERSVLRRTSVLTEAVVKDPRGLLASESSSCSASSLESAGVRIRTDALCGSSTSVSWQKRVISKPRASGDCSGFQVMSGRQLILRVGSNMQHRDREGESAPLLRFGYSMGRAIDHFKAISASLASMGLLSACNSCRRSREPLGCLTFGFEGCYRTQMRGVSIFVKGLCFHETLVR